MKQEQLRTEVAVMLTQQILIIYGKAGIPVLSERGIRRKLNELHHQYLSVKKSAGRKVDRKSAIFECLPKTAEFWPKQVFDIMEADKKGKSKADIDAIDEDKKFLMKMQTDRSASFAS